MTDEPNWHIEDSRTPGRWAGVASYFTEARALQQIELWRARDARGGRPDIHDLMPHLVAVQNGSSHWPGGLSLAGPRADPAEADL